MRKLNQSEYIAAILTIFALPIAYYISRHNYNLFHVFADGISIIIAACVFTIAWNSRHLMDNDYFLLVGIGFFFFIVIDCLHILGNRGMNIFFQHVNLGPTFYIISRYCLAITLLVAPLFIRRKLNITAAFVAYAFATLLLLFTIFYWHVFPATFIEGVGLTPFKIFSDYIICTILVAAIGLLLVNRGLFSVRMHRVVSSSIAMLTLSGLTFTLYTDPFGVTNFIGHLFQIASFYLFYRAFVITGLRNPEEMMFRKLQENEERYRTTVASIGDAVIATDEEGKVTLLNEVAEQLTGWKQREAVGKALQQIFTIINEDTRDVAENPAERVLREGCVAGLANHTSLISRDGREIPIEDSAAPIRNAAGKAIGVVLVFHDVTDKRKAEQEIRSALHTARESESILKKGMERLDIISNTASQLLMSTEPQKIVETLCNRVMEHLDCHAFFNYLVDEAGNRLRLNAYAGIPEDTAREILFLDFGVAVCGCAARDASRIVAENIPTTPDVRTDLVSSFGIKAYAAHPLFSQGKVIGTLSFGTRSRLTFSEDDLSLMKSVADHVAIAMERIRLLKNAEERADELDQHVKERTGELQKAYDNLKAEVEERKRLEDQLRQAHKIEALGTLTGGIAHDFNNILAGMIGFAEMAYEDAGSDDKMRYHLERVLKGGMRGRELVKQMLTFSRKTEYDVKAFAMTPLIEETLRLLRATIPTTVKIDFIKTAKKDIVVANATGIQQILMNLATNAAHAMRENGGTLSVTLSDAYDESSPFVALTVRDTGVGMPPEVMNRVFEPFFTTKETGQGTGMGLAMVYGIVKSFGGDISVHSTPGRGTVFHIYFPRAATDEPIEAVASIKLPTGNEKILLVDDEETLADLGKRMLERLGYSVTATTSSAEALKLFAQDPNWFNLVITDHTMPELTGLRFAEELIAIRADIPVILCSGFSESIDAEKVKAAGIKEFIMKPLTKQELATAVRRVLEQNTSP